jgi:hypothetical protein
LLSEKTAAQKKYGASMMNVPDVFRITTLLVGLVLGWFALATIFAEKLSPKTPQFPQDFAMPDPMSSGSLAEWAAAAAPLRGDLLADVAMAQAAPALGDSKAPPSSEMVSKRERALASATQSLALSPHSSRTWLLLAMLQNQARQPTQSVAEALKMSYFTAPADMSLIPARLAAVSTLAAIGSDDLKSLARGDIRLILTRRPDIKPAITSAYQRGSADGKAYIGEVVRSLDPGFAASLR